MRSFDFHGFQAMLLILVDTDGEKKIGPIHQTSGCQNLPKEFFWQELTKNDVVEG